MEKGEEKGKQEKEKAVEPKVYVPEEKSEKEKRVRALTKIYYSNPKIQEILLNFGINREVVPRYFEGFGKRPDMIQYPSDIMGLVNKGATSLHCSEEIWQDPLKINSEMQISDLDEIRKSWDLLIDIDSKFLDYSIIAAKLIIEFLERYGIKNYGIKFSGSRGFHIIVSGKAFPEEYEGEKMKDSFPKWPRAITEFIMNNIRSSFNKIIGDIDIPALEKKTNLSKSELMEINCPNCGQPAKKGNIVNLKCTLCNDSIKRINYTLTKRRLKCLNEKCPGILEVANIEDTYYCDNCKISNLSKFEDINKESSGNVLVVYNNPNEESIEEFDKVISEKHIGGLDLILVSSRHLFRMPYSLHEKTALSSVVLTKEELVDFSPRDASPLNVKIREYYPQNIENEAKRLLIDALNWKKKKQGEDEKVQSEKYKGEKVKYETLEIKGVTEEMFPPAINKLLLGLNDGKKRGLFILITFLKSLNFTPEYINDKVRAWNKLNNPPLKEGYVKSQIDWHLRQKKKILPPNYENESFYKDLGLINKKQETKNPIVDVVRRLRRG